MQILNGHRSDKPVRSLAFSPDGTELASSARDYKTILWELSTGKYRVIDDHSYSTVAFSPDGTVLATGRAWAVSLWDYEMERLLVVKANEGGYDGPKIAFTADGRTMIVVGIGIGLFDYQTGERLQRSSFGRKSVFATNSLALTPDRKSMATGHNGQKRCVRLWDVESRSFQGEITGPTAIVAALAFSPDGRHLAATAGMTLWVWEVVSKRVVVKHSIDRLFFKDVAFTPDGRFLVFARNDATVSLWDTASWTEAAAYDFGIGPMVSVACAPDGMRAAAGSAKGKIVVFDIDV